MRDLKKARFYLASAMTAVSLLATPAFAEEQQGAGNTSGVNEIVVTAQRREQSVLDVPLTIQASSADQLQSQGIKQITDLQFTTPGYNVSDSNGYTQIFIRGIGNAIFVGADPSVATFIDDVPRIYGSMVNNFVDVQRVEVLKGAQGGLYGRNATGGVVNIITRQPNLDEPHADIRLTYGEHRTTEADAYITAPIVKDMLSFSVAAQRRYSDPYFKNIAPSNPYTAANFPGSAATPGLNFIANHPNGAPVATIPGVGNIYAYTSQQTADFFNSGVNNVDVGNQDFWAVSGKLLFKPSDTFKFTLAGDYSLKNDSQGNATYQRSTAYAATQLTGLFAEFGVPVILPAGAPIGTEGKFEVANGTPGFVYLKDYGVSGTGVLSLGPVDVTSITAYRKQHTQFLEDLAASSLPSTSAFVDNHKHFFYQELRAVSSLDGPLQFVAGGTYLDDHFQGYTDVPILNPLFVLPTARSTDKVQNWSIYGQLSYNFTDQLSLTASGRYVHEKNTAVFYALTPGAFGPQQGPAISASEGKFLPSATLSYKFTDGGNVFLRYARGFKSGGVNPVANASAFVINGVYYASSGSIFKGETVDTFEGGYKGKFFNNKVQVTASAFYNDYKNLQTAGHVNAALAPVIILTIVNAPSARTYGVEGSVDWRVIDPLTVGINAGYLNAKYKDFNLPQTPILNSYNLSGQQMINSPEFQFSFNGNLDQPINTSLNLISNVLVTHSSSVLWQYSGAPCSAGQVVNVTCLPNSVGRPYWLVNARIGIKTSDDKYRLEVFANNLFNEAYTTYGNSNAGNTTQYTWGNPRIIGVEATMHL
jgi:iron complex outermembrane receptor protein